MREAVRRLPSPFGPAAPSVRAPKVAAPAPLRQPQPPPSAAPTSDEAAEIAASGLFDPAYYRRQLAKAEGEDAAAGGSAGRLRVAFADLVSPETDSRDALLQHFVAGGGSGGLAPHPLFESAAYLRANPDVAAAGMNPLTHYLRYGFREGRGPGRLFNPRFYLDAHPDLPRDSNPLQHYVQRGLAEGRRGWSDADAEALLSAVTLNPGTARCLAYRGRPRDDANAADLPWQGLRFGLFASSDGNYFCTALRDLLADGLSRCGIAPLLLDERSQPPPDLSAYLVVAPDEFFTLGQGVSMAEAFPFTRTVLFNVAPLDALGFARSLTWFSRAAAVLDCSF
ncbi:MAG TPA: hypothetical protein VKV26_22290 [Dehalococcoidia bacterium]|nr:hypothetical protein [Dehalococcoidia bacterium]